MYLLIFFLFLPESVFSRVRCGGTYRDSRGVLSTPNFPKRFPTPIDCKWVIDASESISESSSIIVYLTQLFVHDGLTFTEYQIYEDGFQMDGKEIFAVNEENVSNASYVQCYADYLVITLKLKNIEGTHLRVLDGLLDVFGFNITYEITNRTVRPDKCTMKRCGFTGNCYDYFSHFNCQCFPGYSGKYCSEGEKSSCYANNNSICQNGGTCMHAGDSAVICSCKKGFTGTYCDISVPKLSQNAGCEECLISCPFDGSLESVCKCSKQRKLLPVNDSIGFSSTVLVSNTTMQLKGNDPKVFLAKYITKLLKNNFTKIDEVQIPYLKSQSEGTWMTFRFYGLKKDERRIRSLINEWGQKSSIGNVTLLQKEDKIIVTTDPYLYLQSVKVAVIPEKQEFILSCLARGPRSMVFRWFKNGFLVNITANNSNKWTRLVPGEESKDHYTALLGVTKASKLDEGVFTCQVEDFGMQQCRSKRVTLKHHPKVWLDPLSLTVNKSSPFSIKCLSVAQHAEKYIYTWTKDKNLLPAKTDNEHYEVLYPGGSILQVSGLNKTTSYSCLVQAGILSAEATVIVNVIDANIVTPCRRETFEGFLWPQTAPGTEALQKCPKNYTGIVVRSCIMLETGEAKWLFPDYSNCTALELGDAIKNFLTLKEGYEQTTPFKTLLKIRNYTLNKTMRRGEGNVILDLVNKVMLYNNNTSHPPSESITLTILEIIDDLLGQLQCLNKEQQVLLLQKIVKIQLVYQGTNSFYYLSLGNLTVSVDYFQNHVSTPHEYMPVRGYKENFNKHLMIVRVVYRNLYKFLPSKSIIRFSDDRESEYEIISSIIGVWLVESEENIDAPRKNIYGAIFIHSLLMDRVEWDLRCVLAVFASSNFAWDASVCNSKSVNVTATECFCSKQGTMALLLVKQAKLEKHSFLSIILIGCSVSLLFSSLSTFVLFFNWIQHRSSLTFLKLQSSFSISGAMIVFIFSVCNEIPKDFYLYIISLLQAFFYTSMSSQVSMLLIIYSEMVELQRKESVKQAVVGILTGAPLIVVFGNHLAHRTMAIQLEYWWILWGTLSFNVFIGCLITLSVIFTILYCLVWKLLSSDKSSGIRFLENRLSLLRKSLLMFVFVNITSIFSIICVNIINEMVWQYVFSISSVLMGLINVGCLVCKPQFLFKENFTSKIKMGASKSHENSTSSSPEKSSHSQDTSDSISKHMSSPKTSQTYQNSISLNRVSTSNSLNSPDILGTKVFVELDLVASSLQAVLPATCARDGQREKISVAINKAFDEPLKMVDESVNTKVTFSVDSEPRISRISNENLDAVMDSISNDLNYLLNGHVELSEIAKSSAVKTKSVSFSDDRNIDENGIPC